MLVEKYNKLNKENSNPKLDRYFNTKTLQRLKGKGLFCGMDFVNIKELKPIEYYSRFDHSMNVAYTASKLTSDTKPPIGVFHDTGNFELIVPLAGAFHDVGTLDFAHANSFKKGEALTQNNDELDIKSILLKDEELLTYLEEDGIKLDDVVNHSKYPLIDKEIPCLCLDRVDGGVLATCLIWAHTHTFDEIRELYYMLGYLENLNGISVDILSSRFQNFNGEVTISESYTNAEFEDFFKAGHIYSEKLLSKESRYMMEVLGLTLKYYEDLGLFNEQDLFNLSEQEIIERILESKYKDVWLDITSFDKVRYAKDDKDGLVIVSKPKIRQVNPLCVSHMTVCEIDNISGEFYRELNNLYDPISLTDKPITGNLSKHTIKQLSKYKRN